MFFTSVKCLSALKSTLEINDTTIIIIIIITTSTLTDTTGMHDTLGRAPAEMRRLLCAPTCRGRRSPAARFDLSKDRPPCWQRGRGLSAPAVLNRHPARTDKTETGEVAPPGRGKKKRWPNETATCRIFHNHFRQDGFRGAGRSV